jgi:hypothetical protein
MNSLLEQLHDIEGLDSISPWPLAIGWWVLIGIGVIILCGLVYLIIHRIAFKRSWKSDTLLKLSYLEENLSETTARETIMALSEYLRRIALRRFPRKECAGLTGEAWLKWLATHDPKKFDWENRGTLLINLPYAPPNTLQSPDQIKNLIQAVRNWVL